MNTARTSSRGFTLIEIMVVVAIMGVILAMGVPPFVKALRSEGMRKGVNDVMEICRNARARAILGGTQTEVVFHPLERRLEVGGTGAGNSPSTQNSSGLSVQLSDDIKIEMLDINLLEYRESDTARVRFFPNGTSDEMTMILRSDKNEWRKISLEVTTGLADWTTKVQ